jgi:methyl-accepting chemotaxis protein
VIQAMSEEIRKVQEMSTNIAGIAEESSAASQEVAASIEEQTASSEEVSHSASTLTQLAEELQRFVGKFKTC